MRREGGRWEGRRKGSPERGGRGGRRDEIVGLEEELLLVRRREEGRLKESERVEQELINQRLWMGYD